VGEKGEVKKWSIGNEGEWSKKDGSTVDEPEIKNPK